jgi:hypothetical protein
MHSVQSTMDWSGSPTDSPCLDSSIFFSWHLLLLCLVHVLSIYKSSMSLLGFLLRCCTLRASVQSTSHPVNYKTQTLAKH